MFLLEAADLLWEAASPNCGLKLAEGFFQLGEQLLDNLDSGLGNGPVAEGNFQDIWPWAMGNNRSSLPTRSTATHLNQKAMESTLG